MDRRTNFHIYIKALQETQKKGISEKLPTDHFHVRYFNLLIQTIKIKTFITSRL